MRGEHVNGECPYGYIIDPNNWHHLLVDDETGFIVRTIFDMYAKGKRMVDIENWLFDNKILTPNALRYGRTGKPHFEKAMRAPYTWSDKTIYDMIARREYLGHTYTGKKRKVSFKSKKEIKNPLDKQFLFPNIHDNLIDEETWDVAQKRSESRTRPTKYDEIDNLSGVLFCADCAHKMYVARRKGIKENKNSYNCGGYRSRKRNPDSCVSSHYICKAILEQIILEDLQQVTKFARTNEIKFLKQVMECNSKETEKMLSSKKKELAKAKRRVDELNLLFKKIYEGNATNKL